MRERKLNWRESSQDQWWEEMCVRRGGEGRPLGAETIVKRERSPGFSGGNQCKQETPEVPKPVGSNEIGTVAEESQRDQDN